MSCKISETVKIAMSAEAGLKPLPTPNGDTMPYWQGLREARLLIQKCSGCGKLRHYPRPMCDACYETAHTWIEAKGTGTVHSWTETHHAFAPGFKSELPYTLVTVDLAEGVRMQAPLRGAAPGGVRIGTPVRVTFELVSKDLTLPAFTAD